MSKHKESQDMNDTNDNNTPNSSNQQKPHIQEVIVVDGKSDTQRIQLAAQADTLETNGSVIDEPTLERIKHAQETRGVIVFTDPDFPGEKIRKTISRHVPGAKHAFLSQAEARPEFKGSLGIEHASPETIRRALSQVYTERTDEVLAVSKSFLMKRGLIGRKHSAGLRDKLGQKLRIGYTNGKQLKKRLELFEMSEDEVERALEELEGE